MDIIFRGINNLLWMLLLLAKSVSLIFIVTVFLVLVSLGLFYCSARVFLKRRKYRLSTKVV